MYFICPQKIRDSIRGPNRSLVLWNCVLAYWTRYNFFVLQTRSSLLKLLFIFLELPECRDFFYLAWLNNHLSSFNTLKWSSVLFSLKVFFGRTRVWNDVIFKIDYLKNSYAHAECKKNKCSWELKQSAQWAKTWHGGFSLELFVGHSLYGIFLLKFNFYGTIKFKRGARATGNANDVAQIRKTKQGPRKNSIISRNSEAISSLAFLFNLNKINVFQSSPNYFRRMKAVLHSY